MSSGRRAPGLTIPLWPARGMVEIGRKDDSWQKPACTHSAHSLAKLKKDAVNRARPHLPSSGCTVTVSLIMCAPAATAPSYSGFTMGQIGGITDAMPALTRRRSPVDAATANRLGTRRRLAGC